MRTRTYYGDITGKKFGMLTAIRECGTGHDRSRVWLCHCSCGYFTKKSRKSLLSGKGPTSCGCWRKANRMRFPIRTHYEYPTKLTWGYVKGNKWFGAYQRIRESKRTPTFVQVPRVALWNNRKNKHGMISLNLIIDENGKPTDRLKMQCTCGTIFNIYRGNFGIRKYCGRGCPDAKPDHSGERNGMLEVLKFSHTKGRQTFWLCRCECGETKLISQGNLRNNTISCGCYRKTMHKQELPNTNGETFWEKMKIIGKNNKARVKLTRYGLTWEEAIDAVDKSQQLSI